MGEGQGEEGRGMNEKRNKYGKPFIPSATRDEVLGQLRETRRYLRHMANEIDSAGIMFRIGAIDMMELAEWMEEAALPCGFNLIGMVLPLMRCQLEERDAAAAAMNGATPSESGNTETEKPSTA
jgi:hypothetical protein